MPSAGPVAAARVDAARPKVHAAVQGVAVSNRKKQKSRSGCQTCKARRLKCDETKPECRNCVKKGVACPGYLLVLRWTTKYERVKPPSAPEPVHFRQLASAASESIGTRESVDSSSPRARGAKRPPPRSPKLGPASLRPSPPVNSAERNPRLQSSSPPPNLNPSSTSPAIVAEIPSSNAPNDFTADRPSPPITPDIEPASPSQFLPGSLLNAWGVSEEQADEEVECNSQASLERWSSEGDLVDYAADQLEMAARWHGTTLTPDPRSLVDVPTFLIEHWFKSVCSSWSAFDSDANPYRRLASSLWGDSVSVFYALQSMAGASLVETLPHIREAALSARRLAVEALQNELRSFRFDGANGFVLPRSLLLSLFCMSSSLCWMDTKQLGLQLLRQARVVLNETNNMGILLESEDKEFLDFFNGCLTYEEMLRSIVSDEEADIGSLMSWKATTSQQYSMSLHAWTGVSPALLRLFGKTMVLCRRARNRLRGNLNFTKKVLLDALADHREAAEIEEVLLATEMPNSIEAGETAEETVLRTHLRDAAEAFRLSSLHQLYQTFPDLLTKRLPDQVDASGMVPYNVWLAPLALHITRILQRIPPTSSMRCLQPLLCICAGSGLRYDRPPPPMAQPNDCVLDPVLDLGRGVSLDGNTLFASSLAPDISLDDPFLSFSFGTDFLSSSSGGIFLTQNDVETSRARIFVQERLSRLEELLPPKPIVVAKQLLRAVWAAYDAETETTGRTHWLDVMNSTGLQSLFG